MNKNVRHNIDNAIRKQDMDELGTFLAEHLRKANITENTADHAQNTENSHLKEHPKYLRVTARFIEGIVIGSMLAGAGVIGKDVGVSAYRSMAYANEMKSEAANDSRRNIMPVGIASESGRPTNNIIGTVYLDSADGTTVFPIEKGQPEVFSERHSFAMHLSGYVKVTAKGGNELLHVQNILMASNPQNGYIYYKNSSRVYQEPKLSDLSALERGVEDTFASVRIVNKMDDVRGKGAAGITKQEYGWKDLYEYKGYTIGTLFPMDMGIGIKLSEHGNYLTMDFYNFKIKDGVMNTDHSTIFDSVKMKFKGLEKASFDFGKSLPASLMITGRDENSYLMAKNLEGVFSLYEMKGNSVEPLLMDKKADWRVPGGAYNVKAVSAGGNSVRVEDVNLLCHKRD